MHLSIRARLIAIILLAVVACAGALFAITHLARNSLEQRLERARDFVSREVDRLRDAEDDGVPARTHRGRGARMMQSGYLDASLHAPPSLPEPGPMVAAALAEAAAQRVPPGEVSLRERAFNEGTLVVGLAPLARGGYAWAAVRVPAGRTEARWRFGVLVLALGSLLLVAASLHTVVSFERGASSLKTSLSALTRDLGAPVTRPAVRELRDVADGIAGLATGLARARGEQERLTLALAERERLASLGRVAAGMAHEVRNPLASIKLRVDLLQRAKDTPEPLARDLGDISDEVARLDRLVADLLAVAGRKTGPRVDSSLGALATKRAELLAPWAAQREVSVVVEGDATTAVDADAVARALDNLVRNAVEASPRGGTVRVEVSQEGERCAMAVCDQGPGVPPERAAELFEPFFTTKGDGTGLGLALSRSIALSHGGALAYAREGGVTRFVLTLPCVKGTA